MSANICRFCKGGRLVEAWKKPIMHHMVVTIDAAGHVHVHAPIENVPVMNAMVAALQSEMQKAATQNGPANKTE